ncbi:phosphatidylethanolamine N-methyltransferase family domain-containing protein [Actinomyces howellii]|uniref:Uncharacterized protein n=1 Tax=Actinomyces howellii TaxID=52771 RepID=A0A3S4V2S6_9ACTO|nr:transporter [Actinomyces howellii]VEG25381.1 Uncharacterised protein [Actinomyces howellii]
MVATLIRLRWRLTLNALRTDAWAVVGTVLALAQAAATLLLLTVGAVALGSLAPQAAAPVLAGSGALTVLGWVLVPLLFTGADSTLDPRAMAAWIAPSRSLATGLAMASAFGLPGVVTAVVMCLPVLVWALAGQWGAALLALVLAPAALATCVLASRVVVIGVGVSTSRHGRDLVAFVGGVVVLTAAFIPSVLNMLAVGGGSLLDRLVGPARLAGMTPLGWATSAPGLLAQGRTTAALLMSLGAVALPLVLVPLWGRVVTRVMTGPARSRADRRGRARALADAGGVLPWQRRLARVLSGPAAAVAARCLRYWRTDPRYLVSMMSAVVVPVLILAVGAMGTSTGGIRFEVGGEPSVVSWTWGQAPALLLWLPPVLALMCAWSVHDDLAFDSTALWTHVSAGLRGRDDMAGRVLALAVWHLPVLVALTALCAAWTGTWQAAPAVLGASLGLFGAGAAWSCVSGVLLPYQTNAPGENPMKSRGSGMVMVAALIQMIGMLLVVVMAGPAVAGLAFLMVSGTWGWSVTVLVLGVVWGAALAWAGIVWAGRLLDRRYVRVLSTIRSWPGHDDPR